MKNYLEDLLTQLIEEALEIKTNATADFEKGVLFGYYESISKILNLAEAFGIADELSDKLRKFKPEDLL